jgi:hypothetical protein
MVYIFFLSIVYLLLKHKLTIERTIMLRVGKGEESPAGWTALGIGTGPIGSIPDSSSTSCLHRLALGLRGRAVLKDTARPAAALGEGLATAGRLGSWAGRLMRDGREVLMARSEVP